MMEIEGKQHSVVHRLLQTSFFKRVLEKISQIKASNASSIVPIAKKGISKLQLRQRFLESKRAQSSNDQLCSSYSQKLQLIQNSNNEKSKIDIKCEICTYFLIDPVVLRCSHSFCERCLDEYSTRNFTCPKCQVPLSSSRLIRCNPLEKIVEQQVSSISEKSKNAFQATIKKRSQWKVERYIKEFNVNMKVDLRDKLFDWYEGRVKSVYSANQQTYVVIRTKEEQGEHYWKDEKLNTRSHRIAPHGYFTTRKDLLTKEKRNQQVIENLLNDYDQQRSSRPEVQQITQEQQMFIQFIRNHLASAQGAPDMMQLLNNAMRQSSRRNNNNNNNNNNNGPGGENQNVQPIVSQPQSEQGQQQIANNNNILQEENPVVINNQQQPLIQAEQSVPEVQNPQQNNQQQNGNQNIRVVSFVQGQISVEEGVVQIVEGNSNEANIQIVQIEEMEDEEGEGDSEEDDDLQTNSDFSADQFEDFLIVKEWE